MTELVMGLGIVFGLAFHELVGLSPGGVVAPAYLAFYMDQSPRVAATLAVSLLTYGVVAVASRYVLLFGRRRAGLMLLVGFALRWLWEGLTLTISPGLGFDAIGFIVPGLIANEVDRQGVAATLSSLLIVAAVVRLVVLALMGLGWL